MDTLENKRIYSNQFSVSVGQSDAVLIFNWKAPDFNENGNVVGEKTLDTITVALSRENFAQLSNLINELNEKVKNENGKHE